MAQKMICPTPVLAHKLAAKLAQHRPGREFQVYGIGIGYQVIEVRKFSGFGWHWNGNSWARIERKAAASGTAPIKVAVAPVTKTVQLPFAQETPAYVGAMVAGKIAWFGKTNIVSYAIDAGMVTMTLPAKVAEKRGVA